MSGWDYDCHSILFNLKAIMSEKRLENLLNERVLIGDGAMGTMLYQQGVFVNTCFDELNLVNKELIKEIHASYIQAGADFIETNTFGANEYKLSKYGLADKTELINQTAVEIAKECAGDDVLVAGSMGPLGCQITRHSRVSKDQAGKYFEDQARYLADAGVDFLLLETFARADELMIAIEAAAKTGLEIVAQLVINDDIKTVYGSPLTKAIKKVAGHPAVTAVGLNCVVGPLQMLKGLQIIRTVTDKPVSIAPNAGRPQEVEGRSIYMTTPEYMAEYAKRFYENGAKIIGGCCGTTPEHIKEIVKAVRGIDRAAASQKTVVKVEPDSDKKVELVEPVPFAERSKIAGKLANNELITCIELMPPKGADMSQLIDKIKLCADHGIDAINIPDGPRASSRLSPMVTAIKAQQVADIETILHVCCRDKNIISMQSDMLGAEAMGLKNVLLITGDPPKLGDYPDATAVFDLDAIALTAVVNNLNRGMDIAGNQLPKPLSLTISVGANPVASDLPREIDRFNKKVDAGAEFAITQPVFDTEMYFSFKKSIEKQIPFVAGIWPFTSYKNAEFMANEVPGVEVPKKLLDRMSAAKTREAGRKIGVEIAREMIEQLGSEVAGLAISAPFGNVRIALAALGKIDIEDI